MRIARWLATFSGMGLSLAACSGGEAARATVDASTGVPVTPTVVRLHDARRTLEARLEVGHAVVSGPGWGWHLELARYGRTAALRAATESVPVTEGGRTTYTPGEGVREWYANAAGGIEQGFDLERRVAGDGELRLELASDGMLASAAGDRVELRDASGVVRAQYGELRVTDSRARPVPARLIVEGGRVGIAIDDREAEYPISVDPLVWAEQQKLLASDRVVGDFFGTSVALSGTTAVVGGFYKTIGFGTREGESYVFVQSGGTWVQQAALLASDGGFLAAFGFDVAVEGDTTLIGAPGENNMGAAYAFVRTGTTWAQQAKITGSDTVANDSFGSSVSLSVDTALVGAPQKAIGSNAHQGAAYVFVRSGAAWSQQFRLVATEGAVNHAFGQSVALQGDTALIGASGGNAAYVFVRSGVTWTRQQALVGSDTVAGDGFGASVAIDADTAVVGAPSKHAAYVFTRSGTSWTQQAKLDYTGCSVSGQCGNSVALLGDVVVVGGNVREAARFTRTATTWTEQARLRVLLGNYRSTDVALTDTTVLMGMGWDDAAYPFVLTSLAVDGAVCGSPADCISGFCVDARCCETACTGICEACVAPKNGSVDGYCGPIAAKQDPDGECGGALNCAATGDVTVYTCSGGRSCAWVTQTKCAPYACSGSTCTGFCGTSAECASTAQCAGGVCTTIPDAGADTDATTTDSGAGGDAATSDADATSTDTGDARTDADAASSDSVATDTNSDSAGETGSLDSGVAEVASDTSGVDSGHDTGVPDDSSSDTAGDSAIADSAEPSDSAVAPDADAADDTGDADDSSTAEACPTPNTACGVGMTCTDDHRCVPGEPMKTGCGCEVAGRNDGRGDEALLLGAACAFLAVVHRRRASRSQRLA